MLKIIHGDLIKLALLGDFDVIVHGCNCFNMMELKRIMMDVMNQIHTLGHITS